ncbi:UDP-3-O-(3-hydroxymyristoyl)glucosamine N-acyltransferase [Pacificitalea manganoxidans]|uniref:UDP-3-O-acylglucosamine N-acyltransferase n=1 Tax=Pacificitalea manganoxidans TaxID=1411902 RepID=A0A291LZX6_9RHOB|nr:UDP-3-O-(3-hydroxymyristoyl)glucosamine N-acyltransferase [Pacificitalea manganoxidans]ATI42276.1 UDP-3-O-(3-hydroxymyristoyl)glucosamine N-acyltransferase [Pacificitalea manganoxidans]MDR6307899.1 UDP-3-O-[3-hydroxymyristoyl] glucosamine N-acyltransferase [Pacificitalea manganoxidans]
MSRRGTDHSIAEIAAALGARHAGDGTLRITGAAEPAQAGRGHLALAMDPRYADGLAQGQARAAVLWDGADWQALGLDAAIFVARPRYAMAGLTAHLAAPRAIPPGIHPSAAIDASALIGPGAAIGPFVSIGPGARIGANARIAAQASIGAGAVIGADALILEGVRIGHDVRIGDRFIAQPNAVIGGDGFSFVTPEPGAVEAVRRSLGDTGGATQSAYARIHSLGAVAIGDDVEVGANACIDRGTVADTVIGRGTKIDNLVQVGHNVRVGEDCLLCGQTGIAGSTRLGNRVVLGGQVGVTDHLTIGDDVIAGAGTLLRTNQAKGRVMLGNPAMPMAASVESYKALRRLPRLLARLGAERGTGRGTEHSAERGTGATGDNNRLPNRGETD